MGTTSYSVDTHTMTDMYTYTDNEITKSGMMEAQTINKLYNNTQIFKVPRVVTQVVLSSVYRCSLLTLLNTVIKAFL